MVVAGGGVAALELTMALSDLAEDRVQITLVAPDRDFELKPLRTAQPFARDHARRYSLAEIAERFGAQLRSAGLAAIDAPRGVGELSDGSEVAYDALVIAVGARPRAAYERVITFGGDEHTDVRSIAFVVPPGVSWPLPLYELALMTAQHVYGAGFRDVRIDLVTPESAPLAMFGAEPSQAVSALLDEAGIVFHGDAYAEVDGGRITLRPGGEELRAERVVALPVLEGPAIAGAPTDANGFILVDDRGRVRGLTDVYAAGDATDFPVKQGGLACQQADAIAEYLAAQAGAPIEPRPFRPVLRGKLLTGRGSHYLRHALAGGAGDGRASDFSLWFPPTKISGRYLSQWLPHLASPAVNRQDDLDVDVELSADAHSHATVGQ